MSSTSLDAYRTHWPRVGAVLGMALGGASTLAAGKRLTNLRAVSVMNFIALLAHHCEEYEDPGYFPGQLNRGVCKSGQPRNYPLNSNTAMCINTTRRLPVLRRADHLPYGEMARITAGVVRDQSIRRPRCHHPADGARQIQPRVSCVHPAARPDRRHLIPGLYAPRGRSASVRGSRA